jgi:ribosomal protein S18 acetylase RimI-like enzyme
MPPSHSIVIRPFRATDEDSVVALWRACDLVRPWNDPHKDIARKLRVNPEWFLVAESEGRAVASVMVGYEGHRGWINYLAVEPALRRSGLGRRLMAEAEQILRAAGCPKISLQVRRANGDVLAFYDRLGFRPDDVVSLGKRLEHDEV